MASIKIILKKKINAHGKYPLYIQIIKERKSFLFSTGQYVKLTEWDNQDQRVKKSHPNSARLNNLLLKKISEANEKLLKLETEDSNFSSSTLKKEVKNKRTTGSFFVFADMYLDNLEKSKKFNQLNADKPRVKHFREFVKGEELRFKDITAPLLKQYQAWLKSHRKISKRTIINHLVVIRTIFNLAIKEKSEFNQYYPFGKGKIQIKFPETNKIGLNAEELRRLENLQLESNKSLKHTCNIWLFAYYFAGMRISDVLRLTWNDVHDGRLHYAMGKNDKVGSLKIPNKAKVILEQYEIKNQKIYDYIFPELKKATRGDEQDLFRKIKTAIKKFNSDLKIIAVKAGIDKPLTNHIARHTFGNLSGDKIPPHMLQKLYRHSSLTTTLGYQSNFIYKDADDALDAVIGS